MPGKREASVNVGIDVGKDQLDAFILERNLHVSVTNDPAGIRRLLARLGRYRLARVVLEATGRREYDVMLALAERGWPVILCQPIKVRRYAAARGVLAKTDQIDARLLADYAATMRPEVRPIAVGKIRTVRDLVARRRQLMAMRTMELNRLDVMPKALQADIRRHIRHLVGIGLKSPQKISFKCPLNGSTFLPFEVDQDIEGERKCSVERTT